MTEFLYGKNPVYEALHSERRRVHRFFYVDAPHNDAELAGALELARKRGASPCPVDKTWFEKRFPGLLTQHWVLEVSPYSYTPLEVLLDRMKGPGNRTVVALDQIQDPQNLGAILRTSECCGVDGVLIPERRASPITPAVCKASAGAAEHLDISQVVNLTDAMNRLKDEQFWIVGTSAEAGESVFSFQWPSKTLLVLGSEGKGMRRLVKENCDFLIHLPLAGKIQSLNVAATAAVCLYQIVHFRHS
jgi:23S rRNA (guanosine2251-2'-O)-methyltransferase